MVLGRAWRLTANPPNTSVRAPWRSQHFKNAQLEVMKGLRTFLDEQIAARSAATSGTAAHGTRIVVE